jgi:hypothetical protein
MAVNSSASAFSRRSAWRRAWPTSVKDALRDRWSSGGGGSGFGLCLLGALSHPRALPGDAIPAKFIVFVAFFDFRRRHVLREGQRQRVPVVGRRLTALSACRPGEEGVTIKQEFRRHVELVEKINANT